MLFLFVFFSLVFADGYLDVSKSDLHPQFLVVIVTSLVFFKQNCIFCSAFSIVLLSFSLSHMGPSNVNFKLLSLNVRGIRTFEKRKAIFNWPSKSGADICFFQETYSTRDVENILTLTLTRDNLPTTPDN